jgi:hypothetical protein
LFGSDAVAARKLDQGHRRIGHTSSWFPAAALIRRPLLAS